MAHVVVSNFSHWRHIAAAHAGCGDHAHIIAGLPG